MQSVDFTDYDASTFPDGGFQPSYSSEPTDSVCSSPGINTDPIGRISQSPFLVAQQTTAPLKSIIKLPQQRIEIELIDPDEQQINCQVVFTSEPPEMPETVPEIAINGSADAPDLFDPWCDPKNPRIVQFQDISAAAFKIKSGIMVTPCTRSHLSNLTGTQIFFKKDFLQYTGSFKVKKKAQKLIGFIFKIRNFRKEAPVTRC